MLEEKLLILRDICLIDTSLKTMINFHIYKILYSSQNAFTCIVFYSPVNVKYTHLVDWGGVWGLVSWMKTEDFPQETISMLSLGYESRRIQWCQRWLFFFFSNIGFMNTFQSLQFVDAKHHSSGCCFTECAMSCKTDQLSFACLCTFTKAV